MPLQCKEKLVLVVRTIRDKIEENASKKLWSLPVSERLYSGAPSAAIGSTLNPPDLPLFNSYVAKPLHLPATLIS